MSITKDATELKLLQATEKSRLSSHTEQRLLLLVLNSNPFLRNIPHIGVLLHKAWEITGTKISFIFTVLPVETGS